MPSTNKEAIFVPKFWQMQKKRNFPVKTSMDYLKSSIIYKLISLIINQSDSKDRFLSSKREGCWSILLPGPCSHFLMLLYSIS